MKITEVLELLKKFDKDTLWISEHLDELREKHGNKYIAVNNGKVIATNPDHQELLKGLHSKGINPADIPIDFISEEPRRLLL